MAKCKLWDFLKSIFFWLKKALYNILDRKNVFRGYKNKKFKKSKNWHISKRNNPWFWSKNGHFLNFFFLGTMGQENVFYDILKRKNAFLGYKKEKFKKSRNYPWFWSENGHFFNISILGNIGQENLFYDLLQRKSAFLGYKNQKFKKSKN